MGAPERPPRNPRRLVTGGFGHQRIKNCGAVCGHGVEEIYSQWVRFPHTAEQGRLTGSPANFPTAPKAPVSLRCLTTTTQQSDCSRHPTLKSTTHHHSTHRWELPPREVAPLLVSLFLRRRTDI